MEQGVGRERVAIGSLPWRSAAADVNRLLALFEESNRMHPPV
jgi:hypothetical protein